MRADDDDPAAHGPPGGGGGGGHAPNGSTVHEVPMLRKLSPAEIVADRRTSLPRGPERKISLSKGPERKISASKGPERKISSAAIDPMYVHLSEDVDDDEEEEDEDEDAAAVDVYDLDEDYEENEDVAMTNWNCCAEAKINFSKLTRQLKKQGHELKESFKKIDFKKYLKGCCSMELLKKRLPILQWAPKYSLADLQGDLVAGTTVGLTVIPQSIAYAFIAGLPSQYGLYSAFIGSFVYVIFGSAKDITLGPSAISSLLTALFATSPFPNDASVAIVMCFFAGIIYFVMGLFGMGIFMDFISYPVIKAFTSAAAITIAMSQVKKWWGETGVPRDFLPQLEASLLKIPQARLWDFLCGLCCIVIIVFLKKLKEVKWNTEFDDLSIGWKIVNKTIWILGLGRNIIAIVLASVAAYLFLEHGVCPFTLTGTIPPGIPPFRAPPFTVHDSATNRTLTLTDMSGIIGAGYIIVPVLGLIEAMAIGGVFARKFGYTIDPNQELLCYGIGNVLTAFFSGFAITGTFSRTAVNAQSGVRTQAGGIVTGAIVLIALQFLTPLFYYIPQASLAVVLILAVNDMITVHKLWVFWKTRKIDLIPWFVTFAVSLAYNIAYGVIIGAGVSIILLLYPATRPKIRLVSYNPAELLGSDVHLIEKESTVVVAKFYNGLLYPAIEYTKAKILPLCTAEPFPKGVIFDFNHVATIDTTTVQGVRLLLETFKKKNVVVVFCNLRKSVDEILTKSKPKFFKKADTVQDAARVIFGLSEQASYPTGLAPGSRKRRDNNNTRKQMEIARQLSGSVNPGFEFVDETPNGSNK